MASARAWVLGYWVSFHIPQNGRLVATNKNVALSLPFAVVGCWSVFLKNIIEDVPKLGKETRWN